MTFFIPADSTSLSLFLLIVGGVLCALLFGVYFSSKRLGGPAIKRTMTVFAGTAAWLMAVSFFVESGLIRNHPMPGIPIFFLAVNAVAVLFAFSSAGGWLSAGLPMAALVAFQGFRFPLELVLHSWGEQGTIPLTMTWSGQNLDIVTGIVSIVAAPFARKSKKVAWFANIMGFGLLLNVMRVAMLSSPLPFAWQVNPPLQLAFYLPYAWIAPVCVGGALAGHIVLTRALLCR